MEIPATSLERHSASGGRSLNAPLAVAPAPDATLAWAHGLIRSTVPIQAWQLALPSF